MISSLSLFFFIMIRQPPRSTLFPTRRSSDLLFECRNVSAVDRRDAEPRDAGDLREPERSEEHTSELQSHSDLVCRLLLEKKKKKETNARTLVAVIEVTTKYFSVASSARQHGR